MSTDIFTSISVLEYNIDVYYLLLGTSKNKQIENKKRKMLCVC